MEKNVFEEIIVPEVPKVIPNEQLFVYIPVGTFDNPGLVAYNKEHFELVADKLSINKLVLNTIPLTIYNIVKFNYKYNEVIADKNDQTTDKYSLSDVIFNKTPSIGDKVAFSAITADNRTLAVIAEITSIVDSAYLVKLLDAVLIGEDYPVLNKTLHLTAALNVITTGNFTHIIPIEYFSVIPRSGNKFFGVTTVASTNGDIASVVRYIARVDLIQENSAVCTFVETTILYDGATMNSLLSNVTRLNETITKMVENTGDELTGAYYFRKDGSDITTVVDNLGMSTYNTSSKTAYNNGEIVRTIGTATKVFSLPNNSGTLATVNDVTAIEQSINKALLNKVDKSGDTLTGDLSIQSNNKTTTYSQGQIVNEDKIIKLPNNAGEIALSEYSLSKLELSVDDDYKIKVSGKDASGREISASTIDLPLESVVVNGTYDADADKIILTLQNGQTIDIEVAELVKGLINSTEKGAANGVASLDDDAKIPVNQIPNSVVVGDLQVSTVDKKLSLSILSKDGTEMASATIELSISGSSFTQADYNQNDETASDYIKNRPFYESSKTITWDGNTDGKEYVEIPELGKFYKVSDDILSPDDLPEGTQYYITTDGDELETETPTIEYEYEQSGGLLLANTNMPIVLSVANKDLTTVILGLEIPSNGTYFIYTTAYGAVAYLSKITTPNSIKKIDEKFLPNTVVKKTDWATDDVGGVARWIATYGLTIDSYGRGRIAAANKAAIASKTDEYRPIVPAYGDYFLRKCITTNSETLTTEEQKQAQEWLGIEFNLILYATIGEAQFRYVSRDLTDDKLFFQKYKSYEVGAEVDNISDYAKYSLSAVELTSDVGVDRYKLYGTSSSLTMSYNHEYDNTMNFETSILPEGFQHYTNADGFVKLTFPKSGGVIATQDYVDNRTSPVVVTIGDESNYSKATTTGDEISFYKLVASGVAQISTTYTKDSIKRRQTGLVEDYPAIDCELKFPTESGTLATEEYVLSHTSIGTSFGSVTTFTVDSPAGITYSFGTSSLATLTKDWGDGTVNTEASHTYTDNNYEHDIKVYGVTNIDESLFDNINGDNAFGQYMRYVTLGDEVAEIGDYAFRNCKIETIHIPYSVTEIGIAAFKNCPYLMKVVIPDSVRGSLWQTFSGCTDLEEVVLSTNLTSIYDNAFKNCTNLTKIIIPDSVTSIGDSAFSECSSLTKLIIPDSVTSIGKYAFQYCDSLTEIVLPFVGKSTSANNGYDQVFGYIFGYRSSTSSDQIDDTTFQYLKDGIYYHYHIPESLQKVTITAASTIPSNAFYNCKNLTDITLGDTVLTIEDSAFADSSLVTANLGNNVQTIGVSAFQNCVNLSKVNLGNSLITIDASAFSDCTSLSSISFPKTLRNLKPGAFSNTNVEHVEIPDEVTNISAAFDNCNNLKTISLPYNIVTIDANVFENDDNLSKIIVPKEKYDFYVTELSAYSDIIVYLATNKDIENINSGTKLYKHSFKLTGSQYYTLHFYSSQETPFVTYADGIYTLSANWQKVIHAVYNNQKILASDFLGAGPSTGNILVVYYDLSSTSPQLYTTPISFDLTDEQITEL